MVGLSLYQTDIASRVLVLVSHSGHSRQRLYSFQVDQSKPQAPFRQENTAIVVFVSPIRWQGGPRGVIESEEDEKGHGEG
jgi:hypothetical protein